LVIKSKDRKLTFDEEDPIVFDEDEDDDDDGGFKSIYGFVGLTAALNAISIDSNCT